MARIPENEVERLKKEISVQRLAEGRGIKLTRQGANLLGRCPFHDDRTPSLVITPAKNLWHCMGACSMGGTSIDWVMKAEGISFRHAVELLRKDHLPLAASLDGIESRPVKKCTVPKLPAPLTVEAGDRELLLEVVGFYQSALTQSPEAMRYLETRGLRSAEMVARFRLGFANRTLGYGLEAKNRAGGAVVRGRLQKLGIYRESGHEHFNGSLVVPVLDLAGDVVEMYGRKITPNLREGTPNHLYLPGGHRGVWNEEALVASKEIILCEALIDALTFWAAGFRNVTASYGTNGFTTDHRAAFERHGTRRVYIAYDRDEAGDKAAAKLAGELIEVGIDCYRVEFPKGMDANAYALKVTPAAKSLGVLLNRASWLGKGQRPAERVAMSEIAVAVEEEPAAKEEMVEEDAPEPASIAATMATGETPPTGNVLPLAAEPEPAVPMPPMVANKIGVAVEVRGEDVMMRFGDREYRVRGLAANTSTALLKVNLRILGVNLHGDFALHVDTLDMNAARQRMAFCKQAAEELGIKEEIVRHDVGQVWMKLEELRDEQIRQALTPKEPSVTMSDEERGAAMELLRDPRLLERIVEDFARCGTVGEETNKLVGYLGAVSRHLEKPLAVIVQSSSAAGKSSLMDAVLAFVPEEQRVQYSAMTGQSLFYMGETDLQHKVLAIVEEAGAQRASYALKLLQSEGEVSIASTGKDPVSGRHVTHEYRVKGPVMIFMTTTAIDIDEELLNRCLVLTVNEDRAQTQAIHRVQRESQTLDGFLRKRERDAVLKLHRNAQRLLRPLTVINEQAPELSFPDSMTRTRRDHMKFLTLISSIALLHQHQREVKTVMSMGQPMQYIETTSEDVELAKKLLHEVMGRSLDELPPHTRRLLLLIDGMVGAECDRQKIERAEYRFSRRDVREFSAWSDSQLKRHLARLEEMEYLIVHRGGRGQSFVYELFFTRGSDDGERQADAAQPALPGLECEYDGNKSGLEGQKSGSSPAQVRGMSGGGTGQASPVSMQLPAIFYEDALKNTLGDVADAAPVVVLPPRPNGSMNGNGHRSDAAWPA
jgi:DNA primase catalytic core